MRGCSIFRVPYYIRKEKAGLQKDNPRIGTVVCFRGFSKITRNWALFETASAIQIMRVEI